MPFDVFEQSMHDDGTHKDDDNDINVVNQRQQF